MDLTKVNMPSYITVEGVFFDIDTDFRAWINFSRILKNENAKVTDADFLYLDKKPKDRIKGLQKLLEFYNPPSELPRKTGAGSNEIVLDYYLDADLIYSAFLERYNIDLMATDENGHCIKLHWHKFQALLNGLHDTRLNEVMNYRAYNPNNKDDYEKQMKKLKEAWRIPQVESEKDRKAREEFNALFNKK